VNKYSKYVVHMYSDDQSSGVLAILWYSLLDDNYDIRIHDSYTNIVVDSHC
jgi:hypothetical protein